MRAEVRVVSTTTEEFEVRNGLRQGCTLVSTLFNIYISAVVINWQIESSEAGVAVLYKHGRTLVGDRTAKARLSEVKMAETLVADDAALYTTSRHRFETSAANFVKVASEWRLTVSTERMSCGCPGLACRPTFPCALGWSSKPPLGGPTTPTLPSVASPSPTWVMPPSSSWEHQWPSTPPQPGVHRYPVSSAISTHKFGEEEYDKMKRGNSNYDAFPSHRLQVAFGNIVALSTLKYAYPCSTSRPFRQFN